jgi:hypothetical protein
MTEVVIRFDLRFGPRSQRAALAAVLLIASASQLNSESVTISTYYPAPSGVYTNMITTGNTYLSRDGGRVGLGTNAPAEKLHVIGNEYLSGKLGVGTLPLAALSLAVVGDSGITGKVVVGGGGPAGAHLDVQSGAIRSRQTCSQTPFAAVGTTSCPSGTYATFTSGVWTENQIYSTAGSDGGVMLCCTR